MRRRALAHPVLALLIGFVLAVFLVYPIWLTIRGGLIDAEGAFTLYHVRSVFETPRLRDGLLNSLGIACCTTVLAFAISLPPAIIASRFDFRGKTLLTALLLIPLILPPFVGAIGLHHILGRAGSVNTALLSLGLVDSPIDFIGRGGFWAVVVLEALHLYPILYLNIVAALANVDPTLTQAAENLGAGRARRFRSIVLPLIRPGVFAGATIVFIWSFTELGTPLMFEFNRVTPVQIYNGIREIDTRAEPYALTVVLLASALVCYITGRVLFGGRMHAATVKAGSLAGSSRLGTAGTIAAWLLLGSITLVAAVPHLGVVLVSVAESGTWYRTILPASYTLEHFSNAMTHDLAAGSIRNSLLYSTGAVLIDLVLGLGIAYLIVRTRIRGRSILDTLAMLPLAVPGLVLAFGFVAMTLRWPFRDGDPLAGLADVIGADPNPVFLLTVAYAIRRLPYVVRSAVAGLEQTPVDLEDAAMNLGASRWRSLRTVTIPLIAANLIAGAMLAFSFAMLEVSDSLILAQREEHFPITKAIYVLFERFGDGPGIASAMGVWGMALLSVALIGATMMLGRRMGALFRV